ncbi:Uncharacterized membrane protein HdeD, DUF308 family [Halogranum rubrum]|uniref:Uncharacterized membrane protein HdeD, DUF308 family n=1 Tax=Halogranum rubrum TaxID=553466 RepID=A0A1I4BJD9_9EURY|nr:DUF308 domain-containing protein [Halogranum rubrum]SFK68297.1 Uncharacterized membrane protein HdeD, DUF308 family [Halogranum rubrum]
MRSVTDDTGDPTHVASTTPAGDDVGATVGVIAIAVGVVAVAMPLLTGALLGLWLGILLVVLGVARIESLKHQPTADIRLVLSEALRATGYVLVGILLVVFPLEPTRLSSLLAVLLLLDAVGRLVGVVRGTTELRSALVGVALVAIAALLVVSWPSTAAWVLGLLFGLGLILVGSTALFTLRRRSSRTASDRPESTE